MSKQELYEVLFKEFKNKNKITKIIDKFDKDEYGVIEKVDDIKCKLRYKPNIFKLGTHIGQRKLFLNEIQFLNAFKNRKNIFCIYIGAAPGNKTYFLSELFPNITFILVDPNKFNLIINGNVSHRNIKHKDIIHMSYSYETNSNTYDEQKENNKTIIDFIKKRKYKIYIFEELMTNPLSELLAQLKNIVFISDIRTNSEEDNKPSNLDILWNNSMMFNFIKTLQPIKSMLKFRTLFDDTINFIPETIRKDFELSKKNGIDFLETVSLINSNKKFIIKMPKGKLYIQPWAAKSSTETRLIITKNNIDTIKEYDNKAIEEKLFCYNTIVRTLIKHENKNSDKQLNFCHCNDCALENKILTEYGFNKPQIHNFIKKINTITKRPLKKIHKFTIYKSLDNSLLPTLKKIQ